MRPEERQSDNTTSTRSSARHRNESERVRRSAPYGNEVLGDRQKTAPSGKPRRADQVRQAAHDAHGFQTRGHVVVPPGAPKTMGAARATSGKTHAAKTNGAKTHHSRRHKMPDLDALDEAARHRREKMARRNRLRKPVAVARPSKRGRWILAFAAIALVGAGVVVTTRPEFNIERVQVEGAHLTDKPLLARVKNSLIGRNIVRAGLGKTEKFLAAQAPIESVKVKRMMSWPPQIAVSIVERKPFARVGGGENWWVVDQSGVPFRRVQKTDGALLPINFESASPVAGKALPVAAWKRARDFVRVLDDEKRQGREWKLRRIYFDKHNFASLRLTGGAHNETLLQLGNDDWRRKLARARATFAYFDRTGRRASSLNLITYAVPVYTPIVEKADGKRRAQNDENETQSG